jgi:hypothetical protein
MTAHDKIAGALAILALALSWTGAGLAIWPERKRP